IRLSYELIDGYQWEHIIRYYLSKLKVFDLKMVKEPPLDQNIQERVDELINLFRSSL
ncbi:unnamed protein product, partial [Rotaria sp. Silwood1]